MKVRNITENNQHYNSYNKIKDIDALLDIQKQIPEKLETHHVKRHYDSRKRKDQLTIAEKLKIKTDRIIGEKACIPMSINIEKTPIVVYVNNMYIPNNYETSIRDHCGVHDARKLTRAT